MRKAAPLPYRQRHYAMLVLLLWLFTSDSTLANPVTREKALQTAQVFAQSHGLAAPERVRLLFHEKAVIHTGETGAKRMSAQPAYYVFGLDISGFVIVAGDDCASPILGYSDRGQLSADDMPDNLRYWLDGYAQEIAWAQANSLMATEGTTVMDPARQVVMPLMQTAWSQNEPYNLLCPEFSGLHSLTGCVATAMAQIMYFHQWPQDATTEIPSYKSEVATSSKTYKITVAQLPAVTFDWNHLLPSYDDTASEQETTAVAQLMQYCGASVKMQYSPSGSGAYNVDCITALNNHFGYAGKITELERDACQPGTWDELIYHEISNSRPVIISGGANNGFHAFVCDGYDGESMFHINWGWGGVANGFYRLQALNPSFSGGGYNTNYTGFTTGQCALVGISPTPTADEVDYSLGLDDSSAECMSLSVTGAEETDYNKSRGLEGLTVTHEYKKHSIASETYDIGLSLDKNGATVATLTLTTNRALGCYHWTSTKSLRGFGTKLDDGEYRLMAISRRSGTTQWYKDIYAECNYVDITIADGKVSYTNVSNPYIPDMEVTSVEQRFDAEVSSPKQIRISLHNTGNAEYIGPIYLFVNGGTGIYEQMCIAAGAEEYIDMFFRYNAGNCPIVIATDKDKKNIIYEETIQLSNYSAPSQNAHLTVANWKMRNVDEEKMEMYGRDFSAEISLANKTGNDFAGNIRLRILAYEKRGGDDEEYSYLTTLTPAVIPAGGSTTLGLEYPDIAQNVTEIYCQVFNGSTVLVNKGYYTLQEGYATWNGDGEKEYRPLTTQVAVADDVAAADFSQKDFTEIVPGNNPNTIYYFSYDAEIPATLAGHNVVRGHLCDTLTLVEGHDFFVPHHFVASHARYTRVFDTGADGKGGWSTIVLPYMVTTVVNAETGDSLEWFRGKGEEGKQFWLREFAGVMEHLYIDFVNADRWHANNPYIIAVPGQRWGAKWNLVGKPIRFMADNIQVQPTLSPISRTAAYEFVGLTGTTNLSNVFVLNESGTMFERQSQVAIPAGRAFFRERADHAPLLLALPIRNVSHKVR